MKNIFSAKTVKIGLSTMGITALLLVALILVNSFVGLIPENITIADASETKMYSISDAAKRDIAKVKDKVTVYLLSAGGEGSLSETGIHLDTFIKRAASRNKNISYKVVDLYTDSAFLSDRGIDSSTVTIPSIIVESELRHKYIDSAELFFYYIDGVGKVTQSEAQMYQYYASMYGTQLEVLYKFDGEAQLTSALEQVTSETLPTVITLTGAGAASIPSSVQGKLLSIGTNYSEVTSLAIVPACELLIINAPTSDISVSDANLIRQYLSKGGKLMLTTSAGISAFSNLSALLAEYGLYYADGVIIDPTQGSYYTYPNWLIPNMQAHAANAGVTTTVMLPSAHAILIEETAGITASTLFNTSAASYVIPVESTSAEKPDGAESKSYAVGVIAEATNGSSIVWFSSSALLDDTADQYSYGGNSGNFIAITQYLCGIKSSANSEYKPLTLVSEQLTMSPLSRVAISLLVVAVIPLAVLAIGGVYCYKRKMR